MVPEIEEATAALRRGGLIALPTETVYGLAADARNPAAVRKIFEAKGRPVDHPLIVHLAAASAVDEWAADIPQTARDLARAFWPGPLTLVLRRAAETLDAITGGLDTIALRVPDHPVALAVLTHFGGGLAAPSANRYGRVSPTSADDVRAELGDSVQCILDGGPCRVGIESTIVDLSGDQPRILRPGAITAGQIEAVIGQSLSARRSSATRSPGLKATLNKYRRRHPPCLFAGRRAVGEGRLAVCRDEYLRHADRQGGPQHAEFKGWGDVWKARRLRRAAGQDGQSSRRHAPHPASLPDIMTTVILIQCCLKPSHYAPRARVRIVKRVDVAEEVALWQRQQQRVGLLAVQWPADLSSDVSWLRMDNDLDLQARHLYGRLREADARGLDVVVVVPPEGSGLALAVRDRLYRSAGLGDLLDGMAEQ